MTSVANTRLLLTLEFHQANAAITSIRLLKDKGMRTVSMGEEEALVAGDLMLSHRNVPIADALIASL